MYAMIHILHPSPLDAKVGPIVMDLDEDRLIIRKLYSFGLYTFISGLLIATSFLARKEV